MVYLPLSLSCPTDSPERAGSGPVGFSGGCGESPKPEGFHNAVSLGDRIQGDNVARKMKYFK